MNERIQSSLVAELGWSKAKANAIFHGTQPYKREVVNEVAAWLNIAPYELLMHPDEAHALRRLRQTAAAIVAGTPVSGASQDRPRGTGTGG